MERRVKLDQPDIDESNIRTSITNQASTDGKLPTYWNWIIIPRMNSVMTSSPILKSKSHP